MKLVVLITPSAETELNKLQNKKEIVELLHEIENSPLLFFSQALQLTSPSLESLITEKPGLGYKLKFGSYNLVFLKTDQDNKLYLIAILS